MTIIVSVQHTDNTREAWTEGPEILQRLNVLQSQGVYGRDLIDRLLKNRWGVPPAMVVFASTESGARFEIRIPCIESPESHASQEPHESPESPRRDAG
jgi:hypothetical protein